MKKLSEFIGFLALVIAIGIVELMLLAACVVLVKEHQGKNMTQGIVIEPNDDPGPGNLWGDSFGGPGYDYGMVRYSETATPPASSTPPSDLHPEPSAPEYGKDVSMTTKKPACG